MKPFLAATATSSSEKRRRSALPIVAAVVATGGLLAGASPVFAQAGVGSAKALTHVYESTAKDLSGTSNEAGKFNHVSASYNESSQRLTWSANFSPIGLATSVQPNGFTLVVSNGPNPKGTPGELAIFYFDASTAGKPKLTVYNYNAQNLLTSYEDGSPKAGNQTPDRIASSLLDSSWINSLTSKKEADGSLTLGFDINASKINAHNPLYPESNVPWKGAAFGDLIGIWFHPIAGMKTNYSNGYLACLDWGKQGWLDGENYKTTTTSSVPEPGSMALMASAGLSVLGGLRIHRRRRRSDRAN